MHGAVVHPVVVQEIKLAIASRGKTRAEFVLHRQTILRPKVGGQAVVKVPAVRSAHAA